MSSDDHTSNRPGAVTRKVLRGFEPDRVAALRTDQGMSRSDLARIAGVSTYTVYRWEKGQATPQVSTLVSAARALDVPIDDLVRVPRDERFPGDWRILRGLMQPELGKLAGVSTMDVSRIERGEITLTDELAHKLAITLGMDVDEYRECYERSRIRPPGVQA